MIPPLKTRKKKNYSPKCCRANESKEKEIADDWSHLMVGTIGPLFKSTCCATDLPKSGVSMCEFPYVLHYLFLSKMILPMPIVPL